ncbi:Cytochrome P450 [Macrophomina phaseolina MS6]|uniref:Cytochrome P450 n=1 Tax=Macrophomina phaseolina (strain MS6) TaxID=1126212 RepID=K2S0U3_MACPH|nr:Cytochrome P450 [Macrophomina phaseolina MS6]
MFTYKVSAFVPEILYPVLYGAVALQHDYYKWKFDRQLVPLVKRRLAEMDAVGGASSKAGSGPPPDLLSYYIKAVSKSKDAKDRDPYVASARFSMILSGFSFATLSGALFAVLSKLVGRGEDIAVLESEAAGAVAKGEEWTAQSVASLVHLDSFIKEVLRHITFNGFGLALMRCVDAAEGIKLPRGAGTSGDIVLPRGTWVGMPVDAMHRDDSVFEAADEFRPWRFVELAQRQQHQDGEEELTKAFLRNSMIATTDEYLAFGRGKATCPGRFFASDVLKLWLAYIVLNYDIAAPAEAMPSDGGNVSMRIRRKRKTSAPPASP